MDRLTDLLDGSEKFSPEQTLEWSRINNPRKKLTFQLTFNNGNIVAFTLILERHLEASVFMGPLCTDDALLPQVLNSTEKGPFTVCLSNCRKSWKVAI